MKDLSTSEWIPFILVVGKVMVGVFKPDPKNSISEEELLYSLVFLSQTLERRKIIELLTDFELMNSVGDASNVLSK